MKSFPSFINNVRRQHDLMTIEEIEMLVEKGNIIYDPLSVLISTNTKIGTGNIIFPCTSIFCSNKSELSIGNKNIFHSNSFFDAVFGPITIGSNNQFGEGGFTAKTNRAGAKIIIGDNGRYLGGASIFGETILGTGSQILGAINVDSCHLEAGQSYMDADLDRRAGLLKGFGVVRDIIVPAGQVIHGNGSFSLKDIKPQSFFHPKGK